MREPKPELPTVAPERRTPDFLRQVKLELPLKDRLRMDLAKEGKRDIKKILVRIRARRSIDQGTLVRADELYRLESQRQCCYFTCTYRIARWVRQRFAESCQEGVKKKAVGKKDELPR